VYNNFLIALHWDLITYLHYLKIQDTADCTSVVIQNKSSSTVALNMDFGKSRNAMINHPHLTFSTTLSARSTLFVAHLIPENPTKDFKVEMDVSLVNTTMANRS